MAKRKTEAHLRSISGGKGKSEIDELLSGRVAAKPKTHRGRKRELPPQEVPRELQRYADVFAAGRSLEREIRIKSEYARQRLESFCLEEIARQYAALSRRPASRTFAARHSRFKFVFTERTTLTPEKSEALQDLGIEIESQTEVRGIQINYDAIKQHHLEDKLRDALTEMHVPKGVLEEIFSPQVALKESFYDLLTEVVRGSLKPSEKLADKILEVLRILNPATQMRNVEVIGLNAKESYDLVNETEIEAGEDAEVA